VFAKWLLKRTLLLGQFTLCDKSKNNYEAVFFLIRHGSNTGKAPFCKHHVGRMFATVTNDKLE
jgi:hypothetical protein